jgi:hypothetical protein
MKHPWLAILAAVAVLLFGGWVYLARPDHKYRLTFEVVTPRGVVSASNVMAVYLDEFSIGPVGGGIGMKGNAIFMDLAEGRNIIALLAHGKDGSDEDGMSLLAMNAFAAAGRKVSFKDVKRLTGVVPVRGSLIPTLVSFSDLNDPKSARVIEPNEIDRAFGQGYRLQSVSLELMPVGFWPFDFGSLLGQPVTRGIERKLPLLITHRAELRKISRDMPPRFQPQFHLFER